MQPVAIRAQGLGKRYKIGGSPAGYKTVRESLVNLTMAPWRRGDRTSEFWALKDVSFDVLAGEVVGVIGQNGAGKTTLLKILSRVTRPTVGRVEMNGGVASMLEVGTGFHPELTGRENIYLNGVIMGMGKADVDRRFDEILAFAELEKFVDTPVKRYSSGMYVRLAFAVAAHLASDILLVDEILAVGDAAFQKRCLGKMDEVAKAGRTVLFVSHNMGTLTRLCGRGVWIHQGQMRMDGPIEDVVSRYLTSAGGGQAEFSAGEKGAAPGDDSFRLMAVRVRNNEGVVSSNIDVRYPFTVEIEYRVARPIHGLRTGFRLIASDGTVVFTTTDRDEERPGEEVRQPGEFASRCRIPGGFLNKGQYSITVGIDVPAVYRILLIDNIVHFFVESTGGVIGSVPETRLGVVSPLMPWSVERIG